MSLYKKQPIIRTVMLKITLTQCATLHFIRDYKLANNYPPSVQEIAADRGVNSNAAQGHIEALVKKGYVTKIAGQARSILLTEQGVNYLETV